jgi:hypothetical protein
MTIIGSPSSIPLFSSHQIPSLTENEPTEDESVINDLFANISVADYERRLHEKRYILFDLLTIPSISDEFHNFMADSKSSRFLAFLIASFTFFYFPTIFYYNFFYEDVPLPYKTEDGMASSDVSNHGRYELQLTCIRILDVIIGVVVIISGWLLLLMIYRDTVVNYIDSQISELSDQFPQFSSKIMRLNSRFKHQPSFKQVSRMKKAKSMKPSSSASSRNISRKTGHFTLFYRRSLLAFYEKFDLLKTIDKLKWNRTFQLIFSLSLTLFCSLVLINRILYGHCGDAPKHTFYLIENLYCNTDAAANNLPLDSTLFLAGTPIFFVINLRESRKYLIALEWGIALGTFVLAAVLMSTTNFVPFIVLYTVCSYLIMVDFYRQYLYFFILARKLKTTLESNIRLAETNKATELRHMIGNVAHDLKTVSCMLFLVFLSNLTI